MHIKTVNTNSKYKCIVMRGNDPSRVNRGKGYRAVNRLNYCDVLSDADGVLTEACSISTTTLLAVGATTTPRVGSRIYLLRCPARINFSTRNFKLWQWLVSWPWSL